MSDGNGTKIRVEGSRGERANRDDSPTFGRAAGPELRVRWQLLRVTSCSQLLVFGVADGSGYFNDGLPSDNFSSLTTDTDNRRLFSQYLEFLFYGSVAASGFQGPFSRGEPPEITAVRFRWNRSAVDRPADVAANGGQ